MRTKTDNLFGYSPSINKPTKSYRFDTMSLYYKGIYYFPLDIEEHNSETYFADKQFKIQAVYNDGKLRQDTFYITTDFKNFLFSHL